VDLKEHDFDKGAVLGVVDGRNSLVETPAEIVALAEEAQGVLDPDFLAIAPTCELELCPRPVAEEKVKALGQALELGREKL
jgi:methionine synthase II (cobalamin-independent)